MTFLLRAACVCILGLYSPHDKKSRTENIAPGFKKEPYIGKQSHMTLTYFDDSDLNELKTKHLEF